MSEPLKRRVTCFWSELTRRVAFIRTNLRPSLTLRLCFVRDDMKKSILATFIVFFAVSMATAQHKKDSCYVYVVDVAKGEKAYNEYVKSKRAEADINKALRDAQTLFPEFEPLIGEEELTTKNYPFPGSSLVITASVFYTDESMASVDGVDSMQIGITISPKAQRDAISATNNAVAEVTMNAHRDTLRVQQFIKVKRRRYLVGIQCRSK